MPDGLYIARLPDGRQMVCAVPAKYTTRYLRHDLYEALEAENKRLRDMLASADSALSGCGCCASFTAREKWLSDYKALLSSPASEREGKE